jgi:gluconolactonase
MLIALLFFSPAVRVQTGFRYVEGPVLDRRGNLYFTDVPAQRVYRRSAHGRSTVLTRRSGGCVGLEIDAGGRLFAAQSRSGRVVSLAAPAWSPRPVAGGLGTPNDLAADGRGGLYVTAPRFDGKGTEAIFYVAPGKRPRIVAQSVRNPNGIALSPDGRSLYVVAYGTHDVWRFPVAGPGRVGPGRRLMKVAGPGGLPANTGGDGMAVGSDGTVYVAVPEARGIHVAAPDGRFLRFLPVPEKPSNCAITPDGRTLYVTAQTSIYAIRR